MSFAQTLLSIYDELLIYNSNNFFALSLIFGVSIMYFVFLSINGVVYFWHTYLLTANTKGRLKYRKHSMRIVLFFKKVYGAMMRVICAVKKEIFIDG